MDAAAIAVDVPRGDAGVRAAHGISISLNADCSPKAVLIPGPPAKPPTPISGPSAQTWYGTGYYEVVLLYDWTGNDIQGSILGTWQFDGSQVANEQLQQSRCAVWGTWTCTSYYGWFDQIYVPFWVWGQHTAGHNSFGQSVTAEGRAEGDDGGNVYQYSCSVLGGNLPLTGHVNCYTQ
ncbi:MAG: hypothetical protein ACYDCK_00225 [Thermoplasmatota archaeon]